MPVTAVAQNPELKTKYFRSFVSYEIPFQPEEEIPFAATEEMRSFYVGSYDKAGRLIQFEKILLVQEDSQELELLEKAEPGTLLFFQALHPSESQKAVPGEQIPYAATEQMEEYFEGKVGPTGRNCRVTLFRKAPFFKESYRYWPSGMLKERILKRSNNEESVWKFPEESRPFEKGEVIPLSPKKTPRTKKRTRRIKIAAKSKMAYPKTAAKGKVAAAKKSKAAAKRKSTAAKKSSSRAKKRP